MDDDVEATALALQRLARWIVVAGRGSVSASTAGALDTLHRQGRMRVSDLAASEGITQPGMTALVNRLTEAGWARKLPDPTDGRATLVEITGDGRAALADRSRARTALLVESIAGLAAGHRTSLLAARDALEALARQPLPSVTSVGAAS